MKIKEAMFILTAFTESRMFYPNVGEFKDWSEERFKDLEGYDHDFQTIEEMQEYYKDFTPTDELKEMLTKIVTDEEVSHAIILLTSIILNSDKEIVEKFENMTFDDMRDRWRKRK